MDIQDLELIGIRFDRQGGKIAGITLPLDCELTAEQVWAIIDEAGLRATEDEIPTQPLEPPEPNWTILEEFRSSAVFIRAFSGGNESLAVNNAFTLLLSSFTNRSVSDLRFSFNALRLALTQTAVGDFSSEELTWIESKLIEYNFSPEDFNLEAG